jgi:Fe-S-cluster containining protein
VLSVEGEKVRFASFPRSQEMKKKKTSKSGMRQIYLEMTMQAVVDAFKSFDDKIAGELLRLKQTEGITPSCKEGCYFCCRQLIAVPLPEADVISNHIRSTFPETEISDLKARTIKWFQWIDDELPILLSKGMDEGEAIYNHGPFCPLLVEGKCSVYPVRPAICRGYYVSSNPRSCMPTNDPLALPEEPAIMRTIPRVGREEGMRIVALVQSRGVKFEDSVLPLPKWLAITMNWKGNWRR